MASGVGESRRDGRDRENVVKPKRRASVERDVQPYDGELGHHRGYARGNGSGLAKTPPPVVGTSSRRITGAPRTFRSAPSSRS